MDDIQKKKERYERVRETNLAKDPDYYKKMGTKGGGSTKRKTRPFQVDRELAVRAGKKSAEVRKAVDK